MKTSLSLGALLCVVALAPASALAQERYAGESSAAQASGTEPLIGLGVRINAPFSSLLDLVSSGRSALNVYVPINVLPMLRIEPDIGFGRSKQVEERFDDDGNSEWREKKKESMLRLGVGGFYMYRPSALTNIYAGGRFAVVRSSTSQEIDAVASNANVTRGTYTKQNDLVLSLATGGEAYLTTHFSLGGELSLDFTRFGEPKVTTDPETNTDDDDESEHSGLIARSGALFLRWYF